MAINQRHQQIARLLLQGKSQRSVAREMGLTESHLSRICHNPAFRAHMQELQAQADRQTLDFMAKMRGHTKDAAEAIAQMLHDPKASKRSKWQAAQMVLQYAGYGR